MPRAEPLRDCQERLVEPSGLYRLFQRANLMDMKAPIPTAATIAIVLAFVFNQSVEPDDVPPLGRCIVALTGLPGVVEPLAVSPGTVFSSSAKL